MPTIFRWRGIRFYFFSNEGSPREPIHVHAQRGEAEAKFWLVPEIRVAESRGFGRQELAELVRLVGERRTMIEGAWHEYFG